MTDDTDEIAVERAIHGDRSIHLNRAELFLAFTALNGTGMGAARIGERLGVSERSVNRWRVGRAFPQCRPSDRTWTAPVATCELCGESMTNNLTRHRRRNHSEVSV